MNVWTWFRHRGAEDAEGGHTSQSIFWKQRAFVMESYKGSLFRIVVLWYWSYICIVISAQYCSICYVIFLNVMMLLSRVVWRKRTQGGTFKQAPLGEHFLTNHNTHTQKQSGPLQKHNLGQALFPPNTEMQSKWQKWQMAPILKWKGSKIKFNEGRF